jgi:hypothetical protein
LITNYAVGHQIADVGINMATWFLPGGGLIGMATAIAIQAPAVYQPLARRIGQIYLSDHTDANLSQLIEDVAIEGGNYDIGSTFGVEFLQMLAMELLQEIGLGAAASAIPLLGTAVASYLDAKIAATMTWRVGLSAAIYFENGCAWLGDQHKTYERAKLLAGELSAKNQGRYNLDDLPRDAKLHGAQVSLLARYAGLLIDLVGIGSVAEVLKARHNINPDLVDAVLREIRARRIDEGRPSAAAKGAPSASEHDQQAVAAVEKFVAGLRAVGMDTAKIVHLAHAQGLEPGLVEYVLRRQEQ